MDNELSKCWTVSGGNDTLKDFESRGAAAGRKGAQYFKQQF